MSYIIINRETNLHTTLSSMECKSCGGNVNPETLMCTCCGRQYRLVASNDKVVDNDLIGCPYCLADMRGGRE